MGAGGAVVLWLCFRAMDSDGGGEMVMEGQVTATDVLFVAFLLAKNRGVDVTKCHSLEELWMSYLDQLSTEELQCINQHIKSPVLRQGIESRLTVERVVDHERDRISRKA